MNQRASGVNVPLAGDKANEGEMNKIEFKYVIALLLEDAKRLQKIAPNAGTEARIYMALKTINSQGEQPDETFNSSEITPLKCDGVNRVYHDTMVRALKMEIENLKARLSPVAT